MVPPLHIWHQNMKTCLYLQVYNENPTEVGVHGGGYHIYIYIYLFLWANNIQQTPIQSFSFPSKKQTNIWTFCLLLSLLKNSFTGKKHGKTNGFGGKHIKHNTPNITLFVEKTTTYTPQKNTVFLSENTWNTKRLWKKNKLPKTPSESLWQMDSKHGKWRNSLIHLMKIAGNLTLRGNKTTQRPVAPRF